MARITFTRNISFFLFFIVFEISAGKDYFDIMERQCGGTIQLSSVPTKSLVLVLTESEEYPPLLNCHVTVFVTSEARIHLSFLQMDIRSYGACPGDFVTVLDSKQLSNDIFFFEDASAKRHCGIERPKPMTSTGNNVTIRFVSDAHVNGRGFTLLLTAFHEAECLEEEFQCDNKRCIDNSLQCDSHDNCGDGSDNCDIPAHLIAGIAVASALAVLALLFLVVVLRYRWRQKQFESEESGSEDEYQRSSQISAITIRSIPAVIRYPAVSTGAACVSSFFSQLVQLPSYEQLELRPQRLPGFPCQVVLPRAHT